MKKFFPLCAVALIPVLTKMPPASAVVSSVAISPTSQAVASGAYPPVFQYGDGTTRTYLSQTNGGSNSASRAFNVCGPTTFNQKLAVGSSVVSATTSVRTRSRC